MADRLASPAEVLDFWFGSTPSFAERGRLWFGKDPATDASIRERFEATHIAAREGRLEAWLDETASALELIVVLDQFPRNLYREQATAFAADGKARDCARQVLARGFDRGLPACQRMFLYLPFEHSEDLDDQRLSVKLFAQLADEPEMASPYDYALRHYAVIARFGRFPHRNDALGRASTPAELAFLQEPGSRF